jgi:hypothetical protein
MRLISHRSVRYVSLNFDVKITAEYCSISISRFWYSQQMRAGLAWVAHSYIDFRYAGNNYNVFVTHVRSRLARLLSASLIPTAGGDTAVI